jgi:hypothetical protein
VAWLDDHPVAVALRAAVGGHFPPVDGVADVVPPDAAGTSAVVSFTGHSFVMSTLPEHDLRALGIDGFGGATHPRVLLAVAGSGGLVGSIDVVLARRGSGRPTLDLDELDIHDDHPRVRFSRHKRRHVRVVGDERGFVTIGRGLVDRLEVSIELTGAEHGRGAGRALLSAAVDAIGDDELVFAQVAPGNAASLRSFLACGFVPIGSEVLIEHRP